MRGGKGKDTDEGRQGEGHIKGEARGKRRTKGGKDKEMQRFGRSEARRRSGWISHFGALALPSYRI